MELWMALIASVGAVIAASISAWASIVNSSKIQDVHLSLNSRLDKMIAEVRTASFAAGEKAEQVRQELKVKDDKGG